MNFRPLVIFTHHYPFGDMELFLETEVPYLQKLFPHIVVVPNQVVGPLRNVPKGVIVEKSFAETYSGKSVGALLRKAMRALTYPFLYRELWSMPKTLSHFRRLLGYSSEAARSLCWLQSYLSLHPELQNALFYTYWFYDHTTGITQVKQRFPGIRIISRAHGFDLYEEEYPPAYIPFRETTLKDIDHIALISGHGHQYLCDKFPFIRGKATVSRLGIEDPKVTTGNASKSSFILITCSHLIPLKRVRLQIDGIAAFAKKHPSTSLEWHLIGDGHLKEEILSHAHQTLPTSIKTTFHGHLPNKAVFSLYQNLQPDVFILTSQTEGLPVSIMEAHACGIPAIATDVGGISEIVNGCNGVLLPANPTPDEIGKALADLLLDPQILTAKKQAARLNWEANFNAQHNYRFFAFLLDKAAKDVVTQPPKA